MKTWDIPKPCTASWDHMRPADQGRYCSVCQTQVLDCTTMSDEAISDLARHASQKLCVRVKEKYPLDIAQVTHGKENPLRMLVAAAAVMTTMTASYAAGWNTPVTQAMMNSPIPLQEAQDTNRLVVRGQVVDSLTKEVLPYAVVRLKGLPIGSVTDESGQFELEIPDSLISEVIRLDVILVGYIEQTVYVLKENSARPISVALIFNQTIHTVGSIVIDERLAKKYSRKVRRQAKRRSAGE